MYVQVMAHVPVQITVIVQAYTIKMNAKTSMKQFSVLNS